MPAVGDTTALIQYVNDKAPQLGLDPAAVLAVAHVEGWGGTTGDGGHAYGPWQDHLTDFQGRPWYGYGTNNAQVQAWAWSNDGVDYVLNQMATTGKAKGQTGYTAVNDIVTFYERSSDIPGEIKNAFDNWYHAFNTGAVAGTAGSVSTDDPTLQSGAELVAAQSTGSAAQVIAGSAGTSSAPSLFGSEALGKIVARLSSPGFWWSVGFFVLAALLIIVGLLVYFHKQVEQVVSNVGSKAAEVAVAA